MMQVDIDGIFIDTYWMQNVTQILKKVSLVNKVSTRTLTEDCTLLKVSWVHLSKKKKKKQSGEPF